LVSAARHDTEAFLALELAQRREPPYPPVASLVNLIASGEEEIAVADAAADVARWCTALISRQQLLVDVLGPAPCALARIKARWRWHVVLRGDADSLGRMVRYGATRLPQPAGVRVTIDRDPVSLL
jgi:primosomal protein N' (replication factor Y)